MANLSWEDVKKMMDDNPELELDMQEEPIFPEPRSEHQLQVAQFAWIDTWAVQRWPELRWAYAVPNGGHRHVSVGKKMKAEGQRRGVPDVCIPIVRGNFSGLYIENKYGKNKRTPEQIEYMEFLAGQGYSVATCRSLDDFQKTVVAYMGLPPAASSRRNREAIAEAVDARGYFADKNGIRYSPDELISRQAIKLTEEQLEVLFSSGAISMVGVNDRMVADDARELSATMRRLFDTNLHNVPRYDQKQMEEVAGEMADVYVVLSVMEHALGMAGYHCDIEALAMGKAISDIERGVR